MGWTYYRQPGETIDDQKRYLINELIADHDLYEGSEYAYRVIEHCDQGHVLWLVFEARRKSDDKAFRYIGCILMEYERKTRSWGYKEMDESVGPTYYSCPIEYLKLAPFDQVPPEVSTPYARSWREKVERHYRGN